MKLTELNLTEIDENEEYQKEALEISKLLERDCQPFISQISKDDILYRGTEKAIDGFIEKRKVRKDRKPSGVTNDLTEVGNLVSEILKSNANRNNSIFTSGSKSETQTYGISYVVFPINRFEFLWSSKIGDFISVTRHISNRNHNWHKNFISLNDEKFNKIYMSILKDSIESFKKYRFKHCFSNELNKWTNHFKNEAVEWLSRNPESKKTISDLVVHWTAKNADTIKLNSEKSYQKELDNEMPNLKATAKYHAENANNIWDIDKEGLALELAKNYQTDDLKEAIESRNEILIHCDEYYLIDEIFYSTFLKDTIIWPS